MTTRTKKPAGYLPRILDQELPLLLEALGATAIFGVRGSGTVTTARQYAHSETVIPPPPAQFDLEGWRAVERQVLEGEAPRLVRDWSLQPSVWDLVRRAVDDRRTQGEFLMTTNTHPPRGTQIHSGTGRYAVRRMRPMTLYEQGYSTGSVSLDRLLDLQEPDPKAPAGLSPAEYPQRFLTGGWPALSGASPVDARAYMADYLNQLIRVDLPGTLGRRVNPSRARAYLSAHARAIGRPATIRQILEHHAPSQPDSASPYRAPQLRTTRAYYAALERLMVVDDLFLGWSTARFMVRNLADPSLAATLLGYTTTATIEANVASRQILLTCAALRDLCVYSLHNKVSVWAQPGRTSELPVYTLQRDIGPGLTIAVAATGTQLAAATRELGEWRAGRPDDLHAILTSGATVRRHTDGVWEIPLSCLGP